MLDLGSVEDDFDFSKRDEEEARLENLAFRKGIPVEDPLPYQNHAIHGAMVTDLLKSPEAKTWDPAKRQAAVRHWILHVKWENPSSALQLSNIFGFADIAQQISMEMGPPQTEFAGPEQQPPQAAVQQQPEAQGVSEPPPPQVGVGQG